MTDPSVGPTPLHSVKNMADRLVDKKFWFWQVLFVAVLCIAGLLYLGDATYESAPPLTNFVSKDGKIVIARDSILKGQRVFHLRGLMSYGSFWGDGAERGPDFTADALHRIALARRAFLERHLIAPDKFQQQAIAAQVKDDIHRNTYDAEKDVVLIDDAGANAFNNLVIHYRRMFMDPGYPEFFQADYITDPDDLRNLAAFFYWGAWVAGTNRPGTDYSYTHNWPHDPAAGNGPTAEVYLWSFLSILALFLGIGLVLYIYGQMKSLHYDPFKGGQSRSLTTTDLEKRQVRETQRATYKFFALAAILFALQVTAGIIGATDFVRPFGLFLGDIIPFTVARSYHTLFQIMWFFMCWVGYTIFFLAKISTVPKGQKGLIDLLFILCLTVGVGSLVGIYLGQTGKLTGDLAYWFGSQGWEFMEMGRAFQILMLVAFSLWIYIIYRAVKPWLTAQNIWSVPAWLLYGSGVMVFFLFFGLFITPDSNFAVADYWRWMVVHMWVEVTFEVFTTVIVAYMLTQMGLITRIMAERVIFLAVMMFFLTATLGVAHNFYWIAKPTPVIALGSVFSTLQVLPLLLLTLDAWRMRQERTHADALHRQGNQTVVMKEVWLFILAVNFWNVFGAGVFGSLINLPIVNYFEHATYLTGNHAHAAMFGVKGNIAIAGLLFCCQHLFKKERWNAKLLQTAFWSLNIGIGLMMFLDLFPAGLYQFFIVLKDGLWLARSQEIVQGEIFRTLTIFRSVGGMVFTLGGVIPFVWFVLSRGRDLASTESKTPDTGNKEWAAAE